MHGRAIAVFAAMLLASCAETETGGDSTGEAPVQSTPQRLASGAAVASGRICPAPPPLADGQDDLRFTEDDFTRERYESSLRFFADEMHELLGLRPDSAKAWTEREGFWITYTNSEQFIEGFVLRQAAEIERLRVPADSTRASDTLTATGRFCHFVATRQWRD